METNRKNRTPFVALTILVLIVGGMVISGFILMMVSAREVEIPAVSSQKTDLVPLTQSPSRTISPEKIVLPTAMISPTPSPFAGSGFPAASPLAFPGAEGFGKNAIGGRRGRVIEVENLNDAGLGSLRAAIDAVGPRIVIFKVAGIIELKSSLKISNPYITIAGQTSPGGGITLKNSPSNTSGTLIVETHDVIIRYIRVRPGAPAQTSSNGDALEILGPGARNVIIDHCSFSWAIDEVVSTWYDARNITIQWSIISEGLNCSTHEKGCHSMGLLLGSEGSGNISIHHNLFVHNGQRNPLVQTSGAVDFVNNVIYDSGLTPITVNDGYGEVMMNVIGNYYKQGSKKDNEYLISLAEEQGRGMKIFVKGNISPTRPTANIDEMACVKPKGKQGLVQTRIEMPLITTTDAHTAYQQVLSGAGASLAVDEVGNQVMKWDKVDSRLIQEVLNGTGKIINTPSEVGGWPQLEKGTAPVDSDGDGMPDRWEQKYGFNSKDGSDGVIDVDLDGYTNLEEYLNGTDPLHP